MMAAETGGVNGVAEQRQRPLGASPVPSAVERLLDAIRVVESGNNPAAVGDGGRSLGAYQIQRGYWLDAGGADVGYRRLVTNDTACRGVIRQYWTRYAPAALAAGDIERLARVHNGGPWGAGNPKTLKYWGRVAAAMRSQP